MQESSFEEQMRLVLKKYYGYVDEDLKYCSGIMGVPISFLDKFCPEQFEIVGDSRYHDNSGISNDINYIKGKLTYRRILIKSRGGY